MSKFSTLIGSALLGSCLAHNSFAALPEPLDLATALALATQTHPDLSLAEVAYFQARAQQQQAHSSNDVRLDLSLEARWIEPWDGASYQDNSDSRASLIASKTLYDFGQQDALQLAAEAQQQAAELRLAERLNQRKLAVMRAYFNVLLADIRFDRENEAMAIEYVGLDKAREQFELGDFSDIDLLELENRYEAVRMSRMRAEQQQRSTRSLLAQALNQPEDLPSELLPPKLPGNQRPLPDYSELLAIALKKNSGLLAKQQEVRQAQAAVEQARQTYHPSVRGEVAAYAYEHERGSRDPLRASVILSLPLYHGEREDAAIRLAQAQLQQAKAELEQYRFQLRQKILTLWQEIQALQSQRQQVNTQRDFRELYLDRSRALYELEEKTDLGDAMVAQSDARLFAAQTDYQLALAWTELYALLADKQHSVLLAPPASSEEKAP